MAKMVVQCPDCGKFVEAKVGFLKKKTKCTCGGEINTKKQMKAYACAHCGNTFVYNAVKPCPDKCPVCQKPVNIQGSIDRRVELTCPDCKSKFSVDKQSRYADCPLCGYEIDVQRTLRRLRDMPGDEPVRINFGGNAGDVLWKHPAVDFSFLSRLIVREGEVALALRNGRCSEPYRAGEYLLEESNIPYAERFEITDEDLTFSSEVVFISLASFPCPGWGTAHKIDLRDPVEHIPLSLTSSGKCSLRITNALQFYRSTGARYQRMIINDIFGTATQTSLVRNKIVNLILNSIPNIIIENNISFLNYTSQLGFISENVMNVVNDFLVDYGLEMDSLQIEHLTPDDTDFVKRVREREADLLMLNMNAEKRTRVQDIEMEIQKKNSIHNAEMARMSAEIDAMKERIRRGTNVELDLQELEVVRRKREMDHQDMLAKMEHEKEMARIRAEVDISKNTSMPMNNIPGVILPSAPVRLREDTPIYNPAMYNPVLGNDVLVPRADGPFCSKCNRALNPGEKFCPSCGAQASAQVICNACKAQTDANGKFCSKCGARM